jgi:hypothetical protein
VACMRLLAGFLTHGSSLEVWILCTSFGFVLASPGRSAAPHRLTGAVQASECDSKLKFTFVVLIVNSGLDGGFVQTRPVGFASIS